MNKKVISKHDMLIMRLDGHTYQDIADKSEVSRQRVQQLLSPPQAIRNVVYKKADGKCQSCGILVGKSGHVHHVDNNNGEEDYNDVDNLQLLCLSCHRIAHKGDPQRHKEKVQRVNLPVKLRTRKKYVQALRGENKRMCPDCGSTHLWCRGAGQAKLEPNPPRHRYVCVDCACVFLVWNKAG